MIFLVYSETSGRTESIRRQRVRARQIMDSIQNEFNAARQMQQKAVEQRIIQEWIIRVIQKMEEEFANEPEIFSLIEEKVFPCWGKYSCWRKSLQNVERADKNERIYFMRAFSLLHTDIQRMRETLSEHFVQRAFNVLMQVYKEYEYETGKTIVVFEIR